MYQRKIIKLVDYVNLQVDYVLALSTKHDDVKQIESEIFDVIDLCSIKIRDQRLMRCR